MFQDAQEAEELTGLVCEAAEVAGDVGEAGGAEEGDGGVAEGGQVLGAVLALHAAVVFAKGRVADPMQAVFDAPVAPPVLQQEGRVGPVRRDARDGVLNFRRRLAAPDGRPFEPADLSQAGPVELPRQTGTGLQMPLSAAAVSLVERARFRELSLPRRFARRGKNRAGNRPRSPPSVRDGCL